jgi:uncharacterized membrane protein YoaK (UPF0700 family)
VSTINGLPAHVLLVHLVVVLAPATALLLVLCGVWPAARRRLVWVMVSATAITAALTPLTIDAGEWLQRRLGDPPDVATHARLGETMLYVSVGLAVGAASVATLHVWERHRGPARLMLRITLAAVAVVIGVAAAGQVYRIGESGARVAWADQISPTASATQP